MLFDHKGTTLAWEPSTGEFGEHVAGTELPDDTNPRPVARTCNPDGKIQQVTLEVSQACNLRCVYCPHTHGGVPGVRPHRAVHMTWQVASAAMRMVEERGSLDTVISFYGGEPVMNLPLMMQIVETWPQYEYQIDTNGVLVDDDLAAWAAKFNIGWQVSVDGGREANDRYRGEFTHLRAMQAVNAIRAARPDAQVRIAVTLAPPWMVGQASTFIEAAARIDLPFTLNLADLRGSPITPEPFPLDQLREQYLAECLAGDRLKVPGLIRRLFEKDLLLLRDTLVNRSGRSECWAVGGCCDPAVRRLHVMATGELFPCERTGGQYQIGHVYTGVNQARVAQMHKEFHVERLAKGCADCWALRLCGGCWAVPVNCDAERARWRAAMGLYHDLWAGGVGDWMDEGGTS